MQVVLGIDTGGTYTDGVIIDADSKRVIKKAKARTTRQDLTVSIQECIDNLQFDNFAAICMVALSTTLATNAIVEGKGCEVGIVLIGEAPLEPLSVEHYVVIDGGHDANGLPYKPLDEGKLIQSLAVLRGKVAAIAISGFCSVRNPEHELRAKAIVQDMLGLPVVCGHQLTTTLGFYQRTVTAYLNARLLPVITEWIGLMTNVLDSFGIKAPVMIVKSDGSLMTVEAARKKPVETILTGPAASIVGACNLSGKSNALVIDVGGTTTDIAMVKSCYPRLSQEGAVVGGWRTRVKAAEIYTYGLGGDSHIKINAKKIMIGPEGVMPLCYAAQKYPGLIEELSLPQLMSGIAAAYQKTDCLLLMKEICPEENGQLAPEDRELINLIKDQPHSIYCLAKRLGIDPYYLNYHTAARLIKSGQVSRISLTPTDILHVLGQYTLWSCQAAELGVCLAASQLAVTREQFICQAESQIAKELAVTVVQSLISMQGDEYNIKENSQNIFCKRAFDTSANDYFSCKVTVSAPVVAVGAPVRAWLPKVGQYLNMEVDIPEHAEVANAYGAATAKFIERTEVVIKPLQYGRGFSVHLPWKYMVFDDLDAAVDYATTAAKDRACQYLTKAGAVTPEISITRTDIIAAGSSGDRIFVEATLRVVAVGSPAASLSERPDNL